jgi:hypothetical protein
MSTTTTTMSFEARGPPIKFLWKQKTKTRQVVIVFCC